MPSEDAKLAKKEEVVKKAPAGEEEDEKKSLSAMLQARKKNPTNAGTLTTKSGSKATKVKKEEPQDDDFDEPIKGKGKGSSGSSSKPAAKVKKEEPNSDDDDDKPIFKKIPASKTDKVFWFWPSFFYQVCYFSKGYSFGLALYKGLVFISPCGLLTERERECEGVKFLV
jgi:hypothetical protein